MRTFVAAIVGLLAVSPTPSVALDLNDVAKGLAVINELNRRQQEQPQVTQQPSQQRKQVQSASPQTQAEAPDRETVQEIQARLTELGYDPGPIDGLMGRRTRDAIRNFESDSGRSITGIPSFLVLDALRSANPIASNPTPPNRTSVSPSFDCNRAGTPTEFAICASEALAVQDQAIADYYAQAARDLDDASKERLRQQQRSWLQDRNACGGDINCLSISMSERVAALGQVAFPTDEHGGSHDGEAADPIRQTAMPHFFLTNHFTPRQDANRLMAERARIVTLLEYASNESMIEDDSNLFRLMDALPDTVIDNVIETVFSGSVPEIVTNNLAAGRRSGNLSILQVHRTGFQNEFDREFFRREGRLAVEREFPHHLLPKQTNATLICSASFGAFDFDSQSFPVKANLCRDTRLDLAGVTVRAEYASPAAVGPIQMELSSARSFAERLSGNRQVLVATPASLSVDSSGSGPRLLVNEIGAPVLYSMDSLEDVLYRYPEIPNRSDSGPLKSADIQSIDQPNTNLLTENAVRVPALLFALKLAPEVLTDEEWLRLTERQIIYDQSGNQPMVFGLETVADRKASFAAAELVGEYKTKVSMLLADLDASSVVQLEVRPQWLDHRDGKLTSSEPWGYIRELFHSETHPQTATGDSGGSISFADPGLLQRFNTRELPRTLTQDLKTMGSNVYLLSDRIPRIPDLEIPAREAEALFVTETCTEERAALEAVSGKSAAAKLGHFEAYNACLSRKGDQPDDFVFDITMEFQSARRTGQGIFLETHLTGADLYDLTGSRFASLDADDFPTPKMTGLTEDRPAASDPGDSGEEDRRLAALAKQDDPERQSAEELARIETRKAEPVFDLFNVKIGDDYDEALSAVEAEINADRRLYATRESRQAAWTPGNPKIEDWTPYHHGTLAISADSATSVAIYTEPGTSGEGRVTAVSRSTFYGEGGPSIEQLMAALTQKYGAVDEVRAQSSHYLWDTASRYHRPGLPVDANAQGCVRGISGTAASFPLIGFRTERGQRALQNPNAFTEWGRWDDASGEQLLPPHNSPPSLSDILSESGGCPGEFLIAWVETEDAQNVLAFHMALVRPGLIARYASELQQSISQDEAATAPEIKL